MYNLQKGMYVLVRYGLMKGLEGQVMKAANPYAIEVKVLFEHGCKGGYGHYLPGELVYLNQLELKEHPDPADVIEARIAIANL